MYEPGAYEPICTPLATPLITTIVDLHVAWFLHHLELIATFGILA